MKRFLKIFAICFGGLIGVFGATYGALTLFGYFDVPAIYPENIAFEIQKNNLYTNADNNEIFASFSPEDDGFYVTITTTTENVTKKEIQLSLEGVDSGEGSLGNGKISDGVITIPEKVIIGERFLVEPTRKNQTLGFGENQISLDWIIGGHSVVKAKSLDNLALTSKTLKVHIDVPVYDIKTIAVATETDAQASTEFSIGTNFKIDAEFSPANSKYYFAMDGQDGYEEILKKIYVDENSEQRNDIFKRISDDNLSQNIFTALKETKLNKANLTAYCFQNSYEQYKAENFLAGINTDDDIYKAIRDDLITGDSNSLAKFNEVRLDFKKVTDLTYVITNNSSASYKVNNIFTWFVNYQDSSLYSKNLEIKFQSLYSTLDLQSEVKKLGIQILKGDNDSFVYDANLIPYRYGDVKYLAYYSIKKGEEYITYQQYLELELTDQETCNVQFVNENTYQDMSVADKNLYSEIVLSQEDYHNFKLKAEFKEKFSCFYFPYLNKNNIDLSFWQFEFNNARNYKIRFKYFSSDDEIIIEDKFIELNIETIISGEVDFINNEPIELKIDYSKNNDVYLGNIKEYDVSKY